MVLGQEFQIFDWFIIHFTENNGMAFGMEFGGYAGKALLTLFRIIVVGFGIKYISDLDKNKLPNGALIAFGLIIGGALGNIIDRLPDGVVTDFLFFHIGNASFFIFNFADAFISIGAALFFLTEFKKFLQNRSR